MSRDLAAGLATFAISTMVAISQAAAQGVPSAPAPAPAAAPAKQSRAQQLMGDIAPKLADLTDSVLFGDVWARPQLSRRDRSLVTVSALIAMNRPDQLRSPSRWPARTA